METGTGMIFFNCESSIGMACAHGSDCQDKGTACKGTSSVWLDGEEMEDKSELVGDENILESLILEEEGEELNITNVISH